MMASVELDGFRYGYRSLATRTRSSISSRALLISLNVKSSGGVSSNPSNQRLSFPKRALLILSSVVFIWASRIRVV